MKSNFLYFFVAYDLVTGMEILNINEEGVLEKVVHALRKGGVVCVPTDTVYGLIADAGNEEAVQKIFDIKGREEEKPLPVFMSGIVMAREYAEISPEQERFLEKVWPGAVTVVFKGYFKETIGMRMPNDELLLNILQKTGTPLAQTSANPSGKPPARSAEEVLNYFGSALYAPALCVDPVESRLGRDHGAGGGERGGEASSVIDLTGATPKILRAGAVSSEELSRLLAHSGLPAPLGL
ncbi:MAG: L-threonylcarbamoyladenylate synthase [Patescibacteria group bacterium]